MWRSAYLIYSPTQNVCRPESLLREGYEMGKCVHILTIYFCHNARGTLEEVNFRSQCSESLLPIVCRIEIIRRVPSIRIYFISRIPPDIAVKSMTSLLTFPIPKWHHFRWRISLYKLSCSYRIILVPLHLVWIKCH